MKLIQEKQNPLLKRKEITLVLESASAPSTQDIAKQIAEQESSSEDSIVIESIKGEFGQKKFWIKAKIYDSTENKTKYETITRKQRKQKIEEAKKAEEEKKKAEEEAKQKAEQEQPAEQTETPKENQEQNAESEPKQEENPQ